MSNKLSYAEKLKIIRPYVDFNYNLRQKLYPAQKGKIDRYYREFTEAVSNPSRIYRSKDKNKLNKIKDATALKLKGFKIALIPDPLGDKSTKVDIDKNGNVVFKSKYLNKTIYLFNKNNLAKNFEKEINKTINKINSNSIGIMCGKYELKAKAMNKKRAITTAINLINAYNGISSDGKLDNNHYLNWLEGYIDYNIINQSDYNLSEKERLNYKTLSRKKKIEILKNKSKNKK